MNEVTAVIRLNSVYEAKQIQTKSPNIDFQFTFLIGHSMNDLKRSIETGARLIIFITRDKILIGHLKRLHSNRLDFLERLSLSMEFQCR